MMTANDNYRKIKRPHVWDDLRAEFQYMSDFARGLRLETEEEAVSRIGTSIAVPSAELNDSLGSHIQVRHPQLIPYRKQRDEELLSEALECLLDPPSDISDALDDEKITPELLFAWGRLHWAHGVVESALYTPDGNDGLGPARAALNGRKASKKPPEHCSASTPLGQFEGFS